MQIASPIVERRWTLRQKLWIGWGLLLGCLMSIEGAPSLLHAGSRTLGDNSIAGVTFLVGVYILVVGVRFFGPDRHHGPRKIPRLWSAAVLAPMIVVVGGMGIFAVLVHRRPITVQVPPSEVAAPVSALAQEMDAAFGRADYVAAIERAKNLVQSYPDKRDEAGRAWQIIGTSNCVLKNREGAFDAWDALGNVKFASSLRLKVEDACAKVGISLNAGVSPPIDESLDEPTIVAAMGKVTSAVTACYDEYKVPGLVEVAITIGQNGKVKSANASGVFSGTPTGKCIAQAVKTATFPRFTGSPMSISYPFKLED